MGASSTSAGGTTDCSPVIGDGMGSSVGAEVTAGTTVGICGPAIDTGSDTTSAFKRAKKFLTAGSL
jgi:hypothetical protein